MNRVIKDGLLILGILVILGGIFMKLESLDMDNPEAERIEVEKDNEDINKLKKEIKDKENEIEELKKELASKKDNNEFDDSKVKEMEAEIKELREWKRTRQQYINYLYKELYD